MKTLYCILIVLGSCMASANSTTVLNSVSNELCAAKSSSRVALRGSLPTPTTRGVFQPVEVFLNERELNIYYLSELGNIEISITNEQGLSVFNETLSVSKSGQSLIDLKDFPEGMYEIKLENKEGNELSGSFNI